MSSLTINKANQDSGPNILRHIETKHMEIEGYRCKDCGDIIKHFIDFSKHLKTVHMINLNVVKNFA